MKKPHGCCAPPVESKPTMRLHKPHKSHRVGWLRAAVLGANDGIVSTASLIIGVAAGEYVSVSSQSDTEKADLRLEQHSLDKQFDLEIIELTHIYESRGVSPTTAREVADQLMAYDALGAHARDDIGISENGNGNPVQAALASAATFAIGAALPLLLAWVVVADGLMLSVGAASLLFLALLGSIAARAGGRVYACRGGACDFLGSLGYGVNRCGRANFLIERPLLLGEFVTLPPCDSKL